MRITLLLWLIFVGSGLTGRASHIAGGNIELVALSKPGQFQLSLNLYIDDASRGSDAIIEPSIILSVFRQRDHKLMGDYPIRLGRRLPLVYANPACARSRGLETSEVRYSGVVQFDPAAFDDPAGYYIVWEKCCRNQNVINIVRPQTEGMTYYLAFPPLLRNGQPYRNSSPVFLTPNAEYICIDKPFSLAFRATDADGDQLRYSLVTPYNDNIYKPPGYANSPANPPYRLLGWERGFSASQAITGNPALQISASGVLTVRPNRVGLYAFAVLCEEFRPQADGTLQKIGEVRRDHQILVVDCAAQVPPKPIITALNPADQSPATFCEGNFALLQTESDTNFNYQWRVNGYNLPGETKRILRATEPGEYTVLKSFAQVCTRDSVSEVFVLTLKPSHRATIDAPDTVLCVNRPVRLQANTRADFRYQWSLDGVDIPGATAAFLDAAQPGRYKLKLLSETTGCTALDSVGVTKSRLEKVVVQAITPNSPLCEGNPLTAVVSQPPTRLTYVWQRDGQPLPGLTTATIMNAQPGSYQLTVSDSSCSLTSPPALVIPRPQPVLDSLPPACAGTAGRIPLRATPAGGLFGGPGVTNAAFDPAIAGAGRHRLTYAVTNSAGCRGDTSRYVTVITVPTPNLGQSLTVLAGRSLTLQGPADPGLTYTWEPTTDLTSPTTASLTVRPAQTTVYRLTVSRGGLCPVSTDVRIEVIPNLFVPTAFTPNGDGQNDTWTFTGIGEFPQCSVRVFNRWGEVVFDAAAYQQPWDGRYQGRPVGPGAYQFIVRPGPDLPEQRGTVMVLNQDF
ncbi:MAG: gliding motility-associated C-terminal domain-containing protein [Bacteroidetes bacterium]|nr:gliding motility-associated C-terminal domain-containing protein [Fibrella sp.]